MFENVTKFARVNSVKLHMRHNVVVTRVCTFSKQNELISTGICVIMSFVRGWKRSPLVYESVTQIRHVDHQKIAWF